MSKTKKQSLGARGEELAEAYLKKEGYKIVSRNFRYGYGEIDLIAIKDEILIFMEVKSYQAKPLDLPEYRINKIKRKKMIETAYGFLEQNPQYEQFNRQFDVLLVDFSQYPAQITHYPAAFWLEEPF